jgi:hypothetical protein
MSRLLLRIAVLLLIVAPVDDARADHVTIQSRAGTDLERCDQLDFKFDGEPAVRAEQRLSIPRAEASTLTVESPRHGGVHVRGVEGDSFSVLACKGVPPESGATALDQVTVTANKGRLAIQGPPDGRWVVYLIVQAPRAAGLDLEASNGPLAVRDMSGTVRVRTQNGPISLRNCSGRVDVNSQNGPIRLEGSAGEVSLTAQNGPINVRLSREEWTGSLQARTQNGPVQLNVPASFKTALQVESSRHSPWKCEAAACGHAQRSWQDNKLGFTMGSGTPMVRLSSENGPIAIKDAQLTPSSGK